MKNFHFLIVIIFVFIEVSISLPVAKKRTNEERNRDEIKYDMKNSGTEGLTLKQAQDQHYFRYLTQIIGELEKDPVLKKRLSNATDEELKSGKLAEVYDFANIGIR